MANIMIADDHVGIRLLYKELLTQVGHEIIAETVDGLDTLKSYFQVKPDLLIIDNNMAKVKGLDVIQQIFQKDEAATIIMCTGDAEAVSANAYQLGVKEVIPKPFDVKRFVEIVSIVLKK